MKYLLLLLLPSLLYASGLTVQYQSTYFTNELTGIFTSPDNVYQIYDLDPNYQSLTMVDVFYNTTDKDYYNPNPELGQLGCNRKLHITSDGRLYCTDGANQLLLRISVETPFTVLETFYTGMSGQDFDDWLDPDTQYLVFVNPIGAPSLYNFTIFNTSNNQFMTPIIVDSDKLISSGYGLEGYYITTEHIGFGIEDFEGNRPTQFWQFSLIDQEPSLVTTTDITDVHRIIVLNYANTIFINEKTIYTIDISSGQINNVPLDSTISDINKVNHTHFTVATQDQIYLFTVNQTSNELVKAAEVDLSSYLQINGATLNPPDCCEEQGFLQAWVTKPQQDSYFMLDPNTLEVVDYETPFQVSNLSDPYFPPFFLANGTLVSPAYDGYRLGSSAGNFLAFIPVPIQDVYYDPSNDDFVFGFFSGSTEDYSEVTTCYLLVIQKSESSFTTVNLPECPNPTKNSTLNLLDVQCDSDLKCNVVYQAVNAIYVIYEDVPYTVSSGFASSGNTLAFPQYATSQLFLVEIIPDSGSNMGQVVLQLFNFETGQKNASSQVLSLYGTASKLGPDTVIFGYSKLLKTTVHIYNVVSASYVSNVTIAESLVSTLIPLNAGESFVTMAPKGGIYLYQLNGQQVSVSSVNYSSMGTAFIEQTGQSSFVLTTYNVGMQSSVVYSFENQTLIKS